MLKNKLHKFLLANGFEYRPDSSARYSSTAVTWPIVYDHPKLSIYGDKDSMSAYNGEEFIVSFYDDRLVSKKMTVEGLKQILIDAGIGIKSSKLEFKIGDKVIMTDETLYYNVGDKGVITEYNGTSNAIAYKVKFDHGQAYWVYTKHVEENHKFKVGDKVVLTVIVDVVARVILKATRLL